MKKITLILSTIFCLIIYSKGNAQFTFPSLGPYNVPGVSTVPVSVNDAGNAAGVTAGTYDHFTITVGWSDTGFGDTAYSSEARLSVTTSAGTTSSYAPTSGAATNSNSTTLTFEGDLSGDYDPVIDGLFSLTLDQTYDNSEAIWDNISITISYMGFCIGNSQYPSSAITSLNDGSSQGISTCNYAGEYALVSSLVIGEDYVFSSDMGDYITVTDTSNNLLAEGYSPLTVSAITVTDARIHFHVDDSCTTDNSCRTTSMQCSSCIPPAEPDCAMAPITPADGATGVPAYDLITLSWTAPASGPTPTSYNVYAGTMSDGSDQQLLFNVTETSTEVYVGTENTTVYWSVYPMNSTVEATGCSLWSFTTDSGPGVPTNDDLCNAIALTMNSESAGNAFFDINATGQLNEVTGSCFNGGIDGSVWFTFVAPASGEVQVSTDMAGGTHNDTEIAIYEAPSNCADASTLGVAVGCDQDGGDLGSGYLSTVEVTGLTPGNTYYIQVDRWGGSDPGYFGLKVYDLAFLSTDDFTSGINFKYYPNPVDNVLNLKSEKNMERVLVFNMLGQEVLRIQPNDISSEMDLSGLAPGSYFVKVTMEGISETVRIVKK